MKDLLIGILLGYFVVNVITNSVKKQECYEIKTIYNGKVVLVDTSYGVLPFPITAVHYQNNNRDTIYSEIKKL